MAQYVNADELFGSGSAQLFAQIRQNPEFKARAAKYVCSGGAIRKAHELGRPNKSKISSGNASASLKRLLTGFSEDEAEERFFGENISQTIREIRTFLKK